MSDIRIDSQGFSVGHWWFPPFSLGQGECITLCFPQEAHPDQNRIVGCLTGSERVAGLTLGGPIVVATPATTPSGWRRWFHNPTPYDWLKKNTPLSEDFIQGFLSERRMDRHLALSRYAGNERAFLKAWLWPLRGSPKPFCFQPSHWIPAAYGKCIKSLPGIYPSAPRSIWLGLFAPKGGSLLRPFRAHGVFRGHEKKNHHHREFRSRLAFEMREDRIVLPYESIEKEG